MGNAMELIWLRLHQLAAITAGNANLIGQLLEIEALSAMLLTLLTRVLHWRRVLSALWLCLMMHLSSRPGFGAIDCNIFNGQDRFCMKIAQICSSKPASYKDRSGRVAPTLVNACLSKQ